MSDRIEKRLDDWIEYLYGIYGPTLRGGDIETLKEAAQALREIRDDQDMKTPLCVEVSQETLDWFEDWDRFTDFALSASEEWAEAIVAVSHFKRGRIDRDALLDELADAIISARHVAHTAGVGDKLNDRIAEKISKGMVKVDALKSGATT